MAITSLRARTVLVALLLSPNTSLRLGALAEWVWPQPPPSASPNLRNYATVLRRTLDRVTPSLAHRLRTERGLGGESGYHLDFAPNELDISMFIQLSDQGAAELRVDNNHGAAAALSMALQLWRGPLGCDLPDTPPLREAVVSLDHRRFRAHLDLCEARLGLEDETAIWDLRKLASDEPLAERPIGLLMSALYAAGDPAAALGEYHTYVDRLRGELGASPSPPLTELYRRILRHEDVGKGGRLV